MLRTPPDSTPNYGMDDFNTINLRRCDDPEAYNMSLPGLHYHLLKLGEEIGELNGAYTKKIRGFNKREAKKFKAKILKGMPIDNITLPDKDNYPMANEFLTKVKNFNERDWENLWEEEKKKDFAKEIADVYTILSLICSKAGIDAKQAIFDKFNRVSDDMELSNKYKLESINQITI